MSKLLDAQFKFAQDMAMLVIYANSRRYYVTLGHGWRSEDDQRRLVEEGKSKTMNSQHPKRLAIDLNFFMDTPDGMAWVTEKKHLEPLGHFWENFSTGHRWGGFWVQFCDTGHFEMRY